METRKSTDRRVVRTRRALRDALVSLILERGYDEITVQDVIDRAEVGRSTFYAHFADKEDLLVSGFDELRDALRTRKAAHPEPLGFAFALVEHARENRRLFRAIVGRKTGHTVQRRFRLLTIELVREDLESLAPPSPERDAAVQFLAGGFVELLTWWIDSRVPLDAVDVTAHFRRLSAPTLRMLGAAVGEEVHG